MLRVNKILKDAIAADTDSLKKVIRDYKDQDDLDDTEIDILVLVCALHQARVDMFKALDGKFALHKRLAKIDVSRETPDGTAIETVYLPANCAHMRTDGAHSYCGIQKGEHFWPSEKPHDRQWCPFCVEVAEHRVPPQFLRETKIVWGI